MLSDVNVNCVNLSINIFKKEKNITMRKLNKSTYGFIFAIVILIIALAVSLYLGLSGWFYSNTTSLKSDMQLGSNVNLSLRGTETQCVSFTLNGAYLPGQELKQYINLTNESTTPIYVRAKALIFSYDLNDCGVKLGVSDLWTENEDYYYFDEQLESQNKISVASYVKLLNGESYDSHKSYVLTIIVEGLDASLDRQQIWGF